MDIYLPQIVSFLNEHYLLIGSLSVLFYFILNHERRNVPPGPTGLPIIGYLPFLGNDSHRQLVELSKKYGKVFSVKLGPNNVVILNDIKSMTEALANPDFVDRPQPNIFSIFNDNNFVNWSGQLWKDHRRFTLRAMRTLGLGKPEMELQIGEEISYLLDQIESHEQKPLAARKYLGPSASNVVATVIFGKRYNYDHTTRKMLDKLFDDTDDININFTGAVANYIKYFALLKHLPIGAVKVLTALVLGFNKYIDGEIIDHVGKFDANNPRDMVDLYIEEYELKKGTDSTLDLNKKLQGLVTSMFAAGSGTVKDSLEWIILLVAAYPDVQLKVQQEIDQVIGRDRFPTYSDRVDMIYTQAVILETLRFSSLIQINLPHVALRDSEIGGYVIPKGYHVLVNLYAVHHDPDYWVEPEKFNPQRFVSDDGKLIKQESYAPFSNGKRSCPGEALAQVELFLYTTAILQKFQVKGQPGHVLSTEATSTTFSLSAEKTELIFAPR